MAKRRDDQGVRQILGIPYRWNAKRMFANVWNKEDDRILPPKQFGIGWDVNFHALVQRVKQQLPTK